MGEDLVSTLYSNELLAELYDLSRSVGKDIDFCTSLVQPGSSVLDLGCGSGKLAIHLADSCDVTGVDPAFAMLEVARRASTPEPVNWIQADAQSVRVGRQFDYVIMCGHTFQVFLTEQAQLSVLDTIAAHLKPTGRFLFDSRNPEAGVVEHHNRVFYDSLEHPVLGMVERWNESSYDAGTGVLMYENGFTVRKNGRELSGTDRIRYTKKTELQNLLARSGLVADNWFGDWNGSQWHKLSGEIIPFGRLRPRGVA